MAAGGYTWSTNLEAHEGMRLGAKILTRSQMAKVEKEVENLSAILRRCTPLRIDSDALESFAIRDLRERARTFLDPDDEAYLKGERGFLYYVMLGDFPKRVHRVFRLYYVKKRGLRWIAGLLGIKYQTAKHDLERALTVVACRLDQMGREGVIATGNGDR
jgi:DNA-directed RNA polymerase specialized sigma24 family protein